MLNYLPSILLVIIVTSCQSDPFRRPVEPQCIANGDGTAECVLEDRAYTETNTTNYVLTPSMSFGRYQEYVLELEESLRKCEIRKRRRRR